MALTKLEPRDYDSEHFVILLFDGKSTRKKERKKEKGVTKTGADIFELMTESQVKSSRKKGKL